AKSLSPLILALSRRRNNIPVTETFTHIISSALSVGLGGSAGLEAPSVLTGAAFGANTASYFRIDQRHRSLLLGCGAAAAISAIFGSPVAGVLFVAEVLLPEFTGSSLVPMVMSSAVSAVVSRMLMGDHQFFLAINAPWRTDAVPCYVLVGIFCGLVGVYIVKGAYRLSKELKGRFRNPWHRFAAGGSVLAILLFCFPALRGQGYGYIDRLFHSDLEGLAQQGFFSGADALPVWAMLILLVLIILLKLIASVLTVDCGGDGGIFAPSMFMGAVAGFVFARAVNLTGLIELQEFNFVAVGMCGVFSAVMRAPLTGIFLIAEVTGSYILLVPLMIVSAVSCLTARLFEANSIYRKVLVESNLLSTDRDLSMLRRMSVRLNIIRKYHPLPANAPLESVIAVVERTRDEFFPVLDENGKLQGVVYLTRILAAMLNKEIYDHLLVFDLMEMPDCVLSPDDDLSVAMKGFEECNVGLLPVCDKEGVFLGFVGKVPIFNQYRRLVKEA
ncbi:MAG: chloride channel protein, partial [Lentisphaeria bacterium]|nr:chloride channel protein [Lentisphaeria bacterium]